MRIGRIRALAAVLMVTGFSSQAHTPAAYSAVGVMPTTISAVVERGTVIDKTVEVTAEDRRRLAVIGMILMQTRDLPSI